MGLVKKDDGWRMPDELWAKLEPLLPSRPAHPLECHNPRVPDRSAMDAILLALRTGMKWSALRSTGLCHPSSATGASGIGWLPASFENSGAKDCWPTTGWHASIGVGWRWTGPWGRRRWVGENPPQPHGQSETGHQEESADRLEGRPPRPRGRWRQHKRLQAGACHTRIHSDRQARAH